MTPHTAAKHIILKRYLDAWFPILGKYNDRLNYIDGFAGPGAYPSGELGSPMIALNSALAHIEGGTLRKDVQMNFMFVESNDASKRELEAHIGRLSLPSSFRVTVYGGAFREVIGELLQSIDDRGSKLAPTFAFVDPFGFKGIPFELLARILRHQSCEVFVNVMLDPINRFLTHPNDAVVRHFPETFGTDSVLEIRAQEGDQKIELMKLYKDQLRQHATFVGVFEMRNERHSTLYSLFFASNNRKGFLKMKEAMWVVDKHKGSSFSDYDPDGFYSFDMFGPWPLQVQLVEHFASSTPSMGELEDYVIEKTDYLPRHLREVLTSLEAEQRIEVVPIPGRKRHGKTFPRDKVRIRFLR